MGFLELQPFTRHIKAHLNLGFILVLLFSTFGCGAKQALKNDVPKTDVSLSSARSWHYHLMDLELDTILKSDSDVVVTEFSSSQGNRHIWTKEEVEAMKRRPDGKRRIVLSYLSIGEAESYRFYWQPEWNKSPFPTWFVAENCAWPRNFMVRYWLDGWKDIMFKSEDSFLNRIIEAGFDGVYLDRIDVFGEQLAENSDARSDMIDFVVELSTHARAKKSNFIVISQNGEDLFTDERYLATIDGLGKEDLLFGMTGTGVRNPESEITESLKYIRLLQTLGKPVFAVEYLSDQSQIDNTRLELEGYGMVPFFAHRSLDGKAPLAQRTETTIKYGTPEWIQSKCRDKPHW